MIARNDTVDDSMYTELSTDFPKKGDNFDLVKWDDPHFAVALKDSLSKLPDRVWDSYIFQDIA